MSLFGWRQAEPAKSARESGDEQVAERIADGAARRADGRAWSTVADRDASLTARYIALPGTPAVIVDLLDPWRHGEAVAVSPQLKPATSRSRVLAPKKTPAQATAQTRPSACARASTVAAASYFPSSRSAVCPNNFATTKCRGLAGVARRKVERAARVSDSRTDAEPVSRNSYPSQHGCPFPATTPKLETPPGRAIPAPMPKVATPSPSLARAKASR